MNITLLGYYGYRNFGDDILLLSLLNRLRDIQDLSTIWVLTKEDYYGEDPLFQVPRVVYLANDRWWHKLRKYRYFIKSDALLWGGGTCLYEPDSGDIRGMEGFLRNIRLFRILGKRFGFVGIGMGPLRSKHAQRITRAILDGVAFVTFREPVSMEIARDLVGNSGGSPFHRCGDLFFLSDEWIRGLCSPKERGPLRKIAFCGYGGFAEDDTLVAFYAEQLDRVLQDRCETMIFVPMQVFSDSDDNRFHTKVRDRMRLKDRVEIQTYDSIGSLVNTMNQVDFVIGMRLHSLVLADVLRVPNLGIEYNSKVRFYLESFADLGRQRVYRLGEAFTPQNIAAIEEGYWHQREFVDQTMQQHRTEAERNIDILKQALSLR